jgi:hypothetical protein
LIAHVSRCGQKWGENSQREKRADEKRTNAKDTPEKDGVTMDTKITGAERERERE